MKHIHYILLLLLIMFSCKEEDYFTKATDEVVNTSMWDHLESDSSHSYFMELVTKYRLDTLLDVNNPVTLFIPNDEALSELDTTEINMSIMLSYLVVPTVVNVQSFTTANKIQTKSSKFALIEYDMLKGSYSYDGVSIASTSSMYNDGRFYELEDVVLPSPNLYEHISEISAVFKKFIDLQDSVYFDLTLSEPIGFGDNGTIYDSVFTSENLFYSYFFPVNDEFRNSTATFTLFTQEQYDAALDFMKVDLGTDTIPEVWQNEVLMPTLVANNVFSYSLQYPEFEERMVNIRGDSVTVDVSNIDESSRYICSNGVTFTVSDFVIPDSLYRAQSSLDALDLVQEIIVGEVWQWDPDVTIEGRYATKALPRLDILDVAKNDKLLFVDLAEIPEDTLRFTFLVKGVFGAENYRLIWAGSSTLSGQYKVYINGELLPMRDYRGISAEYFDSNEFSEDVFRSVTGVSGNFVNKNSAYNLVDFKVENITEYTDAKITFEYLGPSKDSNGNTRGLPGLIIDYLKLEMYE